MVVSALTGTSTENPRPFRLWKKPGARKRVDQTDASIPEVQRGSGKANVHVRRFAWPWRAQRGDIECVYNVAAPHDRELIVHVGPKENSKAHADSTLSNALRRGWNIAIRDGKAVSSVLQVEPAHAKIKVEEE